MPPWPSRPATGPPAGPQRLARAPAPAAARPLPEYSKTEGKTMGEMLLMVGLGLGVIGLMALFVWFCESV